MTTSLSIARILLLSTFGLAVAWSDLKTRTIPNKALVFFAFSSSAIYILNPKQFLSAVVCAVLFAIFLFPISIVRHRGLGGGDIKLIVTLALLLGRGSHILAMLILASIFGLLHLAFDGLRKRSRPSSIAFAPSLIIAALLSL